MAYILLIILMVLCFVLILYLFGLITYYILPELKALIKHLYESIITQNKL